jgi:hypothetical protein
MGVVVPLVPEQVADGACVGLLREAGATPQRRVGATGQPCPSDFVGTNLQYETTITPEAAQAFEEFRASFTPEELAALKEKQRQTEADLQWVGQAADLQEQQRRANLVWDERLKRRPTASLAVKPVAPTVTRVATPVLAHARESNGRTPTPSRGSRRSRAGPSSSSSSDDPSEPEPPSRRCRICGKDISHRRRDAKTCSDRCRQ